jgi:predicted lipoprotein with Yx(FWY)xxD motif
MQRTTPRRLLLVSMLVGSVGLAAQATAFADAPGRRHVSAVDKKKKKRPTVKIVDSSLGSILVDGKGRTLYVFDLDSGIDASACGAGCASTWPALKAKKPKAGTGVNASLLEAGASGHVAFNGHLLYRYAGDSARGDTNGDGIGGVWHVIGEDGNPIS